MAPCASSATPSSSCCTISICRARRVTQQGRVSWGGPSPTHYDVHVWGDSVSMADVAWVYPTLPKTGSGKMELTIKNNVRDAHVLEYGLYEDGHAFDEVAHHRRDDVRRRISRARDHERRRAVRSTGFRSAAHVRGRTVSGGLAGSVHGFGARAGRADHRLARGRRTS